MEPSDAPVPAASPEPENSQDLHKKIGLLTRQLHDALNELGYADKLRGTMGDLPDAQSRLSYIARLTGDAAEKVLGRVEQAKAQNDQLCEETQRVKAGLIKDPVAAVATGVIMNYLLDVLKATQDTDAHLTEIMMAQDFHDLTGQVIAKVVNLVATIQNQLVQLLIQTAPPEAVPVVMTETKREGLQGPIVDPTNAPDVVTDQSQVDDLLASLGF
ncbi:protein phosphatase CheZ [Ramlibacter sp. H39-3-26]|uniref:protein phosphatase CheZ n=1 Tax=Curvibacter soli TaxID=3031331 RepID=UPI0023DBA35B|nr:protein phosphatase CheZ [Ramlibacter sp. H39-3-26]MDF1485791.1 protein phosphatase CheZ [Ramlibacter sp. H39-3-26]